MKILTKEEEAAHYNATLKGGITGGAVGMLLVSFLSHTRSIQSNADDILFRAEQPSRGLPKDLV